MICSKYYGQYSEVTPEKDHQFCVNGKGRSARFMRAILPGPSKFEKKITVGMTFPGALFIVPNFN